MKKAVPFVTAAASLAILFVATQPSSGQIKKGKSRPLRTHTLMELLVGPHCGGLKKSVVDSAPADDKAWGTAAEQAELLNEASAILMADDRCPDKVWADACKALDEATRAMLKAIEAKDAGKAKEAFGAVGASCGACHKAHKKE